MIFQLIKVDALPKGGLNLPNTLFPFIMYFVKQAKWPFIGIAVFYIISTTLMSLASYFVKLFVDTLEGIENKETFFADIFWVVIGYILLCGVLQSIFWRLANILSVYTYASFANMMRRQLSIYMNHHAYQYFQDDFAGRLSSKIMETPYGMRQMITNFISGFIYNSVVFVVSFVLLAMTGYVQLLIMLAIFGAYAVILKIYLPKVKQLSKVAANHLSHVRGCNVDFITNILNVKLFARREYEDARFLKALQSNTQNFQNKDLGLYKLTTKLDIIMKSIWILPALYVLYAWRQDWVTTGDVAMVMSLSIQLGFAMWSFSFTVSSFFENLGQVQEGMETITKSHTVIDKEGAGILKIREGNVDINNMSFCYGRLPVFKRLNLSIPAGQKVGFIGPSGAGKSTLIQLLLRLYDIQDGEILIDGQNIADVQQAMLRKNIAVIPQSTDLFHRSLRENIGYGRPDASENEIIEAAKRAHAHDFIQNMEDKDGNKGYDAMVGERGVKLSGGQRQRIAIARAILKDAPILILDEATSALDSESEKLIQKSLSDLMKGKTVIAIAHRLSTIAHLDRLIVLHEGEIIEDGTHNQLLNADGLYAKLWSMQSGAFLGKK